MMHPLLFLSGYAVISFPETESVRVVNACAVGQLSYFDLGVSDGRRKLRMSLRAAARMERACARENIDVRVECKRGLPIKLIRVFCRPGILIGFALAILATVFSQSVIWEIRIVGNEKVPSETILTLLEECGVRVGVKKRALDIDSIENRALIVSDELSWISVNVIGNIAEVEVREVLSVPKTEDYVCSNLVAKRNGTVVELIEVRGNLQVELGEAVSEGQLLVGGIYGSDTEGFRFVRTGGKVMALCPHEYNVEIPLKYEKKDYTGRKKVKKSLIFFEKEVKFFGNSRNLYASCDTIERVEFLNFFGLGDLPIGIRTVEYVEYNIAEGMRSEEQAAEQANFELWQKLYAEAPDAQLVSKNTEGRIDGNTYILTARIECIENIALEREIEVQIEE
ncbi:MAG: hypothetical protein E7653_06785 [Ruminococcaceae bacterium]|nr:hypothetical protein [Oscillospiraceae bacterium]